MEFWKKNWMQVLTLALCVCLLAVVWKQNMQLQELESKLAWANDELDTLWGQIDSLTDQMRQLPQSLLPQG